MTRTENDPDRGLHRAPVAPFVCLASELEPGPRGATLRGEPLTGIAYAFADDGFSRAVRYERGRSIGESDPGDLFPDHPRPSRIVSHLDGIEGSPGEPFDFEEHLFASHRGTPFEGLLVDRRLGGAKARLLLFSKGEVLEMREVSRDGRLTARAFSTPDGWHVGYRWRDDGTLEHFEVETSRGKVWLTYPSPGELGTSWLDLDAPMFERLLDSETFTSGFPERPHALDDVTLADSLNVWGGLFLEERLESLCRNSGLGSVNKMSVDVPEASRFELLERVILSCDLAELSFIGEEDGARSFEDWFRLRNGTSPFEGE